MHSRVLELKSGKKLDMLEMDFVDGDTIEEYVSGVIKGNSQNSLATLAEEFRTSINELLMVLPVI